MKLITPYWDGRRCDPDKYHGMTAVRALNMVYAAERIWARKQAEKAKAEPERGYGLDGRPLHTGVKKHG